LDIFRFKGLHTEQAISNKIYKILIEFDLKIKIIVMTTDNDSNIVLDAKLLKSNLTNTFIHYRYIVHVLNLIVTAGLEVVKIHIKNLRKLIKII